MTPEEILLKAAEDQVTNGHNKESFYSERADSALVEKAPACAYGSLARVSGSLMQSAGKGFAIVEIDGFGIPQAAELLAKQIRAEVPSFLNDSDYTTITRFNDSESTTGEDVALMMKKAAHHG